MSIDTVQRAKPPTRLRDSTSKLADQQAKPSKPVTTNDQDKPRKRKQPKPIIDAGPSQLLRVNHVAALIGVHPMTLWRWVREGNFLKPHSIIALRNPTKTNKKRNSVTAWRRGDVEAWIAKQIEEAEQAESPKEAKATERAKRGSGK